MKVFSNLEPETFQNSGKNSVGFVVYSKVYTKNLLNLGRTLLKSMKSNTHHDSSSTPDCIQNSQMSLSVVKMDRNIVLMLQCL